MRKKYLESCKVNLQIAIAKKRKYHLHLQSAPCPLVSFFYIQMFIKKQAFEW